MLADVPSDARDVGIVESGVDFVEDEEGRGLVGMDGEEEGKGGHSLLAAGEVFHVAKAFERGHCVVLESSSIWLVGFFGIEVAVQELILISFGYDVVKFRGDRLRQS